MIGLIRGSRQSGLKCTVICDHRILNNPPKIGTILTVKHSGYYSNGTLKAPFFWRERNTEDIILNQWPLQSNMSKSPQPIWTKKENIREFFDWLSKDLLMKDLQDWYNVSSQDITEKGGSSLLARFFDHSLYKALQQIYPNHEWLAWKFKYYPVPYGYWSDKRHQQKFIEWVGKELQVKKLEDWYRLSNRHLQRLGPLTVLRDKGLSTILQEIYPSHSWNLEKLEKRLGSRASQRILFLCAQDLFPNTGKDES